MQELNQIQLAHFARIFQDMNDRAIKREELPVKIHGTNNTTNSYVAHGSLLQSVGPILWKAIKSGQLLNPQCELTEPDPDILCEYDVKIPMSEGFSVTANIYRSKNAAEKREKVPVVMCAHTVTKDSS